MKTIGVLGGMGPQATMDFEARVHREAQQLIPPHRNSGYPPMVVYYHRRPPFALSAEGAPLQPLQPDPGLLEAAQWLGTRADFLVISANAPHLFLPQIEAAAGKRVLSIIEVTLAEVRRRGWRKTGVLGFGQPDIPVYTVPMQRLAMEYETIDSALQARLNDAVLRVHEGQETEEHRSVAQEALAALRGRGVAGIIPGCTEIPLLLGPDADAPDLVNPAQLLAEAAVREAMDE